jgi:hypothetical protein
VSYVLDTVLATSLEDLLYSVVSTGIILPHFGVGDLFQGLFFYKALLGGSFFTKRLLFIMARLRHQLANNQHERAGYGYPPCEGPMSSQNVGRHFNVGRMPTGKADNDNELLLDVAQ